jgi:hypothetical protein
MARVLRDYLREALSPSTPPLPSFLLYHSFSSDGVEVAGLNAQECSYLCLSLCITPCE